MTQYAPISEPTSRHPRTIAGVVLAFLGAIALTIGMTGSPATGLGTTGLVRSNPAAGFTIELYTVVRDLPGTETSLGSWAVPDELRGLACVATSTPENNPSIHPGNNLRIVSASSIMLTDVEGTGNPVASTDQITLGDQVEVILVMGPDGVYSAGLAISFDCPPPPTTTTTTTTTTTVEDTTTTTTVADTTTSTIVGNNPPTTSSTTSTTPPCEWNPDLEPGDPECTTTTVAIAPPTTVGTGSNTPTTLATQLPRTGPDTNGTTLMLGALLFLVGGVMVLSTRREPNAV